MVALTYDRPDPGVLIRYNEAKVARGIAECLLAGNMPLGKDDLSPQQRMAYLRNRCSLNANIQLPCLHAILGFHPLDGRLRSGEFAELAYRYMDLIGFGRQPFLLYSHWDTYHPHLHLVTTNIEPDGNQIYTHRLALRSSIPAAQKIESEFGLVRARSVKVARNSKGTGIVAYSTGKRPASNYMAEAISFLRRNYRFSCLTGWNALLGLYGIRAYQALGDPSKLRYYLTDHNGRPISRGLSERKIFSDPRMALGADLPGYSSGVSPLRVRTVLAQTCSSGDPGPERLSRALSAQGAEAVSVWSAVGDREIVVIDHIWRQAVPASMLGLEAKQADLLERAIRKGGRSAEKGQLQEGNSVLNHRKIQRLYI